MSMRNPPRYREAYPRFLIDKAIAHAGSDRPVLVWRNHLRQAVGTLRVEHDVETKLVIRPAICGLPYCEGTAKSYEIDVISEYSGFGALRYYHICGRCRSRMSAVLFNDGAWWCPRCFGLRNRSALLERNTRLGIELDALDREIGRGRPVGMRQSMYARKSDRMKSLRDHFRYAAPPTPNVEYTAFLTGEWQHDSDWVQHFERNIFLREGGPYCSVDE